MNSHQHLNLKSRIIFLVLLSFSSLSAQMPDVVINEFLASNQSAIQDPDFGEYSDWLELFNTTDADIDISGYFLTDNLDDRGKWQFPNPTLILAESYLIIWADDQDTGLHTNFKISRGGEELGFCDPDTNTIDSIRFGNQEEDISFGRNPNSNSDWVYFLPSSPGTENNISHTVNITPEPQFSQNGGFYSTPQVISFINTSSLDIYYSLDGTPPDDSSTPYTDPLTISETTPIRAIAYNAGSPPSAIITQTYFIDIPVNLPVISIVTDPANFFDNEIGIYVTGTNGVGGYCAGVVGNVNQDWERPVNLELYDMAGETGLNQRAGIKIFGGCSRHRFPQKSLSLYARRDYGDGSFNYRLFQEKDMDNFESFVLRSAADDQLKTMFRDAAAQQMLATPMDADYQAYQPVVVYLNGEYWGIHNIREKLNEHYFEANFGVDPENVNILANGGGNWDVHHGSNADYLTLMSFVTSNNLDEEANFLSVQQMMDVDQYIDYMIGHIYQAESDWPGNNIKFWKANTGEYSRWRWINFDLDGSLTSWRIDQNMIYKCTTTTGPGWPNPEWSTRLFRNLLENQHFKNKFLNQYSWYMNTAFDSTRIVSIVDSLADRLRPEMPAHINRWGGLVDPVGSAAESWIQPTFDSMEAWETNVDDMRIFARERQQYTIQNMINHFGLSGASDVQLDLNTPGAGVITINNRRILEGFNGKYFNDLPIQINATPIQGSQFSHWEVEIEAVENLEIFTAGSEWKYHDHGGNLGTAWRQTTYNDESWSTGVAQLGYGDGDEATIVDYGDDSANKHITTYFRKSFDLLSIHDFQSFSLRLLVDDGAVAYLNGTEIARVNMPDGLIFSSTTAATTIPDETVFHQFAIDPALIETGSNIMAVEIHQASATSSDISFDCSFLSVSNSTGELTTYETPELEMTFSGNINLTAHFDSSSSPIDNPVVISEINYRSNVEHNTEDWVELYNRSGMFLDMSSWTFNDASNDTFIFPENYLFGPEDYLVICRDIEAFQDYHSATDNVLGDLGFGFSSEGEWIGLLNPDGELVDEVEYGVESPWPGTASGTGFTIELSDLTVDNSVGENWVADQLYGTPGRAYHSVVEYRNNQKMPYSLSQNYPNPFNPITTVSYSLPEVSHVKLIVFDMRGQEVIVLQDTKKLSGRYEVQWNGLNAAGNSVATGIYLCRFVSSDYSQTIKMLYLK